MAVIGLPDEERGERVCAVVETVEGDLHAQSALHRRDPEFPGTTLVEVRVRNAAASLVVRREIGVVEQAVLDADQEPAALLAAGDADVQLALIACRIANGRLCDQYMVRVPPLRSNRRCDVSVREMPKVLVDFPAIRLDCSA